MMVRSKNRKRDRSHERPWQDASGVFYVGRRRPRFYAMPEPRDWYKDVVPIVQEAKESNERLKAQLFSDEHFLANETIKRCHSNRWERLKVEQLWEPYRRIWRQHFSRLEHLMMIDIKRWSCTAVRQVTRKKSGSKSYDLPDSRTTEGLVFSRGRFDALVSILNLLPPQQKRCAVRYWIHGLTQAEIALELGISQQVVSEQLSAVLKKLHEIANLEEGHGRGLLSILPELSPLAREAVKLCYEKGYGQALTAQTLRISQQQLVSLLSEARTKVRSKYGNHPVGMPLSLVFVEDAVTVVERAWSRPEQRRSGRVRFAVVERIPLFASKDFRDKLRQFRQANALAIAERKTKERETAELLQVTGRVSHKKRPSRGFPHSSRDSLRLGRLSAERPSLFSFAIGRGGW